MPQRVTPAPQVHPSLGCVTGICWEGLQNTAQGHRKAPLPRRSSAEVLPWPGSGTSGAQGRRLRRALTQRGGSARGHTALQELLGQRVLGGTAPGHHGQGWHKVLAGDGGCGHPEAAATLGQRGSPQMPSLARTRPCLRLGAAVAEEAAGGCAALMPLRCGNFLPAGRSRIPPPPLDTERKRDRSCSSALGPGQPRHRSPPAHPWLRSFSVLSSQRRTATALPSRHCVKMSSIAALAAERGS